MPDTVHNTPKLSIIVPVYNTQERLPACLDSLLAQKMSDFELILVDDGSTDRSGEICWKYAARDHRIRFFSKPNAGVGAARNLGLDQARGEWLAFCDSDDTVEPDLYAALLELAAKNRADLVCCALTDIAPGEVKTVTNFPFSDKTLISDYPSIRDRFLVPLLTDSPAVHGYLVTCLFRREIVESERIRFMPGIVMKEDTLFLAEYLLRVNRICAIDRPLYNYLRFEHSACTGYYRARTSYFREKNWYLLALERFRIFRKGKLEVFFPQLVPGFLMRLFLHHAQMICCEQGFFPSIRSFKLRELQSEARQAGLTVRGGEGRLFRLGLLHCLPLLILLLFMKRKKDALCRTIEHWGDKRK